ncbi:MAG: hypothetical protein AB1487_05920 [Thermodesulfobacteriota bacterium]
MGKDGKAIEHFRTAIELKKDYVPAYVQLIDCFKDYDLENAIKTAEMGLKHSPNSEILKKKLAELQSLPATKK